MSPALFSALLTAAAPQWIVMPVHAENPPPTDPTLLRTTRAISYAIADKTTAKVRVLSRELRDEHCTDDGHRCPAAIARLLDVDRVIALELADDLRSLTARVYERPARLAIEVVVPCTWNDGPQCEPETLAEKLGVEKGVFDAAALDAAWSKIAPRLAECFSKGPPAPEARLSFSLQPSGRPIEVRVQPKKLQRGTAYTCAARVAESLRVPPFEGPVARQVRPLVPIRGR